MWVGSGVGSLRWAGFALTVKVGNGVVKFRVEREERVGEQVVKSGCTYLSLFSQDFEFLLRHIKEISPILLDI
jgi:hypothetical protein